MKKLLLLLCVCCMVCGCDPHTEAIKYMDKGNEDFDAERYAEAVADYSRAIKLDPKYTEAYNRQAEAAVKCNAYALAEKNYSKIIELEPNNADAYMQRGIMKYRLGEKDNACKDLNKASALGDSVAMGLMKDVCQ